MEALNLVQWPAMALTMVSAWLVASTGASRRMAGFWLFLLSNLLWVIWGWHSGAPALIVLQLGLAALNIRGALKSRAAARRA